MHNKPQPCRCQSVACLDVSIDEGQVSLRARLQQLMGQALNGGSDLRTMLQRTIALLPSSENRLETCVLVKRTGTGE
jgi:hypothetical protein